MYAEWEQEFQRTNPLSFDEKLKLYSSMCRLSQRYFIQHQAFNSDCFYDKHKTHLKLVEIYKNVRQHAEKTGSDIE